MRTTGIVRNMDKLGRLVIPMELRRTLEIKEGDHIEVFREGENVVVRKATSAGIVKKVDKLGRLVIPMELRNILEIADTEPIEFLLNKDQIVLRKYKSAHACHLTGDISQDNYVLAGGKLILSPKALREVVEEIKKLAI
ncbi:AbrB/MazE/SpoVT family DNA-binding domain-containing protein [Bacillus cereus]|uniref:AbrB/MazE/SpoVT family DNA-binding domain-containing protein n=1 Tax=Bacillati TaxID=1783272 RepID=UPI000676BBE7|nr:AbrB/MazE/SpoVT family DNA-binding domain-containing protein [Bacillus thuringiensis]MEB8879722.1 AbrB/MazE/SpoVT family DNA-binding domain-containing protein [Bacillus cereus]AKR38501.1 Transition state regulatory protein AbrB [Bacillus thuringiensis serovar indiana]MEB9619715.1 AbrB/MazE/SpoVT family DNA-binding domain-containing protein [Bacillus cereus]MEB9643747.1 AbrB/MazE/SpoVT family DNA-binding domain-containing protein [Bacillus cereus]MEB9648098.1 AbrB/MazE/SpoVT family DNA-bindi